MSTDRGANPLYQAPGARVLWTNPDPSASFGAQTIEVPDLDKYEWYYIEAAYSTRFYTHVQGVVVHVPDMDDNRPHHVAVVWYEWGNNNAFCASSSVRCITISRSKCQVVIGQGSFGCGNGSGAEATPDYGIPLKIVGIRL